MIVKIGEMAKLFKLKDQLRQDVDLKDFSGKRILLSFHPLAWTSVCAQQMESLEGKKEEFDRLNTVAFGISVDSVPCKKAWAKSLNIEHTQLLCDFWKHGEVAKLYGIFIEENGTSERANIIIDENQKVAFVKVYPISQLPDIDEIISELGH
ncbi:MAG TPA: redoxin domain-containing protein [Bacteroidales bacterium]|nr:redoxin domain-containing protein [Bacteroidales bacterium]